MGLDIQKTRSNVPIDDFVLELKRLCGRNEKR